MKIVRMMMAAVAVSMMLTGCVYKGAKVTEGTDLAIGLNVPVSEGTLQIQALNYLSGFRLGVDRNAVLKCDYTVCESNSYLGVVHTAVNKTVHATVEPCETEAAKDDQDQDAEPKAEEPKAEVETEASATVPTEAKKEDTTPLQSGE